MSTANLLFLELNEKYSIPSRQLALSPIQKNLKRPKSKRRPSPKSPSLSTRSQNNSLLISQFFGASQIFNPEDEDPHPDGQPVDDFLNSLGQSFIGRGDHEEDPDKDPLESLLKELKGDHSYDDPDTALNNLLDSLKEGPNSSADLGSMIDALKDHSDPEIDSKSSSASRSTSSSSEDLEVPSPIVDSPPKIEVSPETAPPVLRPTPADPQVPVIRTVVETVVKPDEIRIDDSVEDKQIIDDIEALHRY